MPASYSVVTTFPPGTSSTAVVGPYLMPVYAGRVDTTQPLSIYVTAVAAANTTSASPGVAYSDAQPAFTLQWTQNLSTPGLYMAQIKVAPGYVWSADPATRAQMAQYFNAFRSQVETLEVTPANAANGGLIPGGTLLVLNRVATNLPLRFDEILLYVYNFNALNQTADLTPGMLMRAEWAGYQYCDAPGGAGYALNAFTNTGSSRYSINQRFDQTIALDAFLASLAPGYALSPSPTCPTLAAGPLDWSIQGNARRRWRLVLPSTLAASGNVDNLGSSSNLSSWLLGADTFADLDAATADVLAGNTGCGKAASGHNPIVSISFNSRVAVIPEFSVVFNNQPIVVTLGTTLRNVIQQLFDPAPYQFIGNNGIVTSVNVKLQRWTQITDTPASAQANSYTLSNFQFQVSSSQVIPVGPLGDSYDMPLVKGDVITTAQP